MYNVSFQGAPVVTKITKKGKLSKVVPQIKEKLSAEFGEYIYQKRFIAQDLSIKAEHVIEKFKNLCQKYNVKFDDYMPVFFKQLSQ